VAWHVVALFVLTQPVVTAQDKPAAEQKRSVRSWSPAQREALQQVDALASEIVEVNRAIWKFAETALEEKQSAELFVSKLREAGFDVRTSVAGMPTAFVASYGSGRPVIGILAEYDALAGMSQKVADHREPLREGAAGHACGHSGLGAGAFGAAIAVKRSMEKQGLKGTLRLYGTPAEETAVGKVYMVLAGEFKDLDACLHWHPGDKNDVWSGSSKALISARFAFHGTASHASANPDKGRSALDAVELMNVGANFLREHVKEDARFHYVIPDGGDVPNIVPEKSSVWYFVRADSHNDASDCFAWVHDVAKGAALMTRTRLQIEIETDCHELVPNPPLSELLHRNLESIGPPGFTEEERAFARRLQQPLIDDFQLNPPQPLDESLHPLTPTPKPSKGSTDVGDVSWHVPTGGFRTACFPAECPGHTWQNVAAIGSSIGEKGIHYAARVLAVSAIELLEKPETIVQARADWQARMQNRKYTTLIPAGQSPGGKKR
jgi:aminobenzoyl-glutamate utilization protein B